MKTEFILLALLAVSLTAAPSTISLSNTPSQGGMEVDAVIPDQGSPGSIVRIIGSHFGASSGSKIVALSSSLCRVPLTVRSWSDTEIRAVIPIGLEWKEYSVLVYYDSTYRSASDSRRFRIKDPALQMRVDRMEPPEGPSGTFIGIIGFNLGSTQGTRFVALSREGGGRPLSSERPSRLSTPAWGDHFISAQIPRKLPPGLYSVNIFYDARH